MNQELTCAQYIEYLRYVVAAYSVVWIGLFAYLLNLTRRRRVLARELRELRELLLRGRGTK